MTKIEGVLFDLSGVLYEGERVIEGSVETVAKLRRIYPVRFVTNTTRKLPKEVYEKVRGMGFDVAEDEIFTALDAARRFLQEKKAGAYPLVYAPVAPFFDAFAAERPDYVVVADAYTDFDYERLNTAFRHLMDGAGLVAVAKNRYFKDADGGLSLDAGGFVTLLEYASGREATIVGKPSRDFFHLACRSMGVSPRRVLMVGDDIESDIAGAKAAGLMAALVRTGKFRPEDLERGIVPDAVLDSVADLPGWLAEVSA